MSTTRPAAKKKKPALIDLFYLGLAYERLGHKKGQQVYFDKANDMFARVQALDTRNGKDGKPIVGRWARASQSARQTMMWLLDSGKWKPARDVSKIKWASPGK